LTIHVVDAIQNASPVIRNNHLDPNPDRVGIVVNGGSPHIVNNTIEGCYSGLAVVSPPIDAVIEGSVFLNNRQDIEHDY
jgi:nitrous oxidase accessory protein NosD